MQADTTNQKWSMVEDAEQLDELSNTIKTLCLNLHRKQEKKGSKEEVAHEDVAITHLDGKLVDQDVENQNH